MSVHKNCILQTCVTTYFNTDVTANTLMYLKSFQCSSYIVNAVENNITVGFFHLMHTLCYFSERNTMNCIITLQLFIRLLREFLVIALIEIRDVKI